MLCKYIVPSRKKHKHNSKSQMASKNDVEQLGIPSWKTQGEETESRFYYMILQALENVIPFGFSGVKLNNASQCSRQSKLLFQSTRFNNTPSSSQASVKRSTISWMSCTTELTLLASSIFWLTGVLPNHELP